MLNARLPLAFGQEVETTHTQVVNISTSLNMTTFRIFEMGSRENNNYSNARQKNTEVTNKL